jgi:hypothetical protein
MRRVNGQTAACVNELGWADRCCTGLTGANFMGYLILARISPIWSLGLFCMTGATAPVAPGPAPPLDISM